MMGLIYGVLGIWLAAMSGGLTYGCFAESNAKQANCIYWEGIFSHFCCDLHKISSTPWSFLDSS